MYYIVFIIFYLFSLLPFFVLYRISDFIFVLVYHVFGYRKKIVMENLSIAFPEKTEEEKKIIAKKFYKNFVDTFIETIKMMSLSKRSFSKRCTIDFDICEQMIAKGKSIQYHSGHQMNWEYGNWIIAKNSQIPFVGVYQPIGTGAFNKLFLYIRGRCGSVMVSTGEFRTRMHELMRNQYSIGLAADQNTNPDSAKWLYFFSKPVPFIPGPERGAVKNNTAVIFVEFKKLKRGHYHFSTALMCENGNETTAGELTIKYRNFLEEALRKNPDNYLWTHRRWRHEFAEKHSKRWADDRPMP